MRASSIPSEARKEDFPDSMLTQQLRIENRFSTYSSSLVPFSGSCLR